MSFKQNNREIIFDVAKAAIVEVIFKVNLDHSLVLADGFYSDGDNLFKLDKITRDSISFIYHGQDKHIVKEFYFPKDSYVIELKINTRNISSSVLTLNSRLSLGTLNMSSKNPQSRYYGVFVAGGEKNWHLGAGKEFNSQDVKFIGLRDQYFCAIVEPVSAASGYIKKLNGQESEIGIQGKEINLKPNEQIGQLYRIYLGPQDSKTINNIKPEWSAIIYYGTFDFIAQLLLQLLGFFYSLVHNWGLAIILLSLVVYLVLFPLTLKQMRSMKEMQLLQPKIEALRCELKNNPQKLNKEIMELYKEHKVNPLGGCLPLLLQMPIFFALYQALIRSVALRGAKFLWIQDLSAPDHLFTLKNSIPFLGNHINILPILMAIGMFVQQKISMAKTTGEAAQQQKMMSIIMPIMFGVIFYQMPSGLVLYWFVNSTLMLAYQFRINRQK
ncbi:MAG: membrane protein insertase YidC [Candidatus Omnitrophica bacterium]|nr:membrane protein insertase YidC [Candidatus Omnitrophota bacterium]